MEERSKRRKFPIVDRSLQYRFLVIILAYGMITVIILAATLFVPDIVNMNNQNLSIELRGAAAERILTLHMRVWPAIIAVGCIFGLHSFRTFHRIIGPLYRFRWAFEKVTKGDLNFRVKLRTKDYLNREEEMFNEMLDVIAGKWRIVQSTSENALRTLGALEESVIEPSARRKEPQPLLKTHRRHLEALRKQIQFFQLNAEKIEEQFTPDSNS